MRALSFALAFGFVLAGNSIAGTAEASLPGIGTFAYSGPPVAGSTAQTSVLASRL
jgi:hypothetical protein